MISKKGFTLIELLVVVAIIGVISAIGIVTFNGYLNKNKATSMLAQHKMIVNFIRMKLSECHFGAESFTTIKYGDLVVTNCNEYFQSFQGANNQLPRDVFRDQFDRDNGYKNVFESFQKQGNTGCQGRNVSGDIGISRPYEEVAAGFFSNAENGYTAIGPIASQFSWGPGKRHFKWCPENFSGILVVTNLATDVCYDYLDAEYQEPKYAPNKYRMVTCIPIE